MPRNAATADDSYRPDAVHEDEPRYLRRQKPVEIRRKKFGGKSASFYRRAFVFGVVATGLITAAALAGDFLYHSPQVALLKPEQIELTGNHVVSRDAVLQQFVRDRGRSVLSIPLDTRRSALEELSWVETANVQRILPNRIRVEISERTPIAFLRNGTELGLIDAHGVILDRPRGEDFQFPIVTGLSDSVSREERGRRMATYQQFLRDIDIVRAGSSDRVSEIDLSNPKDLRAVMTGISSANDSQAVTIQFGAADFGGKYRLVVDNFAQWQASNGHVRNIDLQYSKQVILNTDSSGGTTVAKSR
ncbi:MAG TPA: FtsQ-type POTRA domain-containing protein [Candidatus Eremiobacteraceae bacterium]|jgi:cell division protein FtsQ|nr:FtsQ-type POTRA domain-containing protein [Candidatus Eremiobacteraceae bacterium]